ncbi:COX15/CtaA family protein [Nocardioides sp. TRM66260-LWL]|uniref:COX15/CtaA family protein n=1 Tax=Nocardioides sp. TRM66260-LWL TaxID=2874478 RepID=UPI001CC4F3FF|nr:COX15/CtaA family protein [Nocardioides sp. TRM66260-LWL]MBZ5733897.1 COX15/CtaA family protein [Nocardioides sp. TRM66260-LWL]
MSLIDRTGPSPAAPAVPVPAPREPGRLARLLPLAAWASIVANIGIVVTGGAVRLTGSGLGCPTWPRCTDAGYTPHGAYSVHAAIEFGNRLLTFVLVAIAIATVVAAWSSRRRDLRWLAIGMALGIPLQAIIGGITVLADLNPWIVSLHLMLSMVITAVAVLFLRLLPGPLPAARHTAVTALAWGTFALAWVVLYVGTVVTGSGPHAGDANAPRNGLDPLQTSQLHADVVMLFVGLTLGLLALATVLRDAPARRAALLLVAVTLGQSAIGFVQYFTGLPEILVGAHMLGAGVLVAVTTWVLLAVRHPVDAASV